MESPEFVKMAHEEFLKKRAIYIGGKIEGSLSARVCSSLVYLNETGSDPITLYIDSSGGEVAAGLDIYDMVKASRAPVTGVVIRFAGSMAAIIFEACTTRKIYRNGELMFHTFLVEVPLDMLRNPRLLSSTFQKSFKRWDFVVDELKKKLRKTKSATLRIFGRGKSGKTYSAAEALRLGLVDKVIK